MNLFELHHTPAAVPSIELGELLKQRNGSKTVTPSRRPRGGNDHRGRRTAHVPHNLPRRRGY